MFCHIIYYTLSSFFNQLLIAMFEQHDLELFNSADHSLLLSVSPADVLLVLSSVQINRLNQELSKTKAQLERTHKLNFVAHNQDVQIKELNSRLAQKSHEIEVQRFKVKELSQRLRKQELKFANQNIQANAQLCSRKKVQIQNRRLKEKLSLYESMYSLGDLTNKITRVDSAQELLRQANERCRSLQIKLKNALQQKINVQNAFIQQKLRFQIPNNNLETRLKNSLLHIQNQEKLIAELRDELAVRRTEKECRSLEEQVDELNEKLYQKSQQLQKSSDQSRRLYHQINEISLNFIRKNTQFQSMRQKVAELERVRAELRDREEQLQRLNAEFLREGYSSIHIRDFGLYDQY